MEVRCSMFKLLVFHVLVAWCGAKHVALDPFEVFTDRDIQDSIRNLIHNGIYSHKHLDASQVEVVTPVKVSHNGALVSRVVDHSHAHGHARARRDLHEKEQLLPHELHYNITVDGQELRLDLRPSVTFITPAMVVERHVAGGRTRDRPLERATACHYTGSVRGQPRSSVAISACNGLAGVIHTDRGEIWIEPSTQTVGESDSRPHVIYRRSAVDKVEAYHRQKRAVDTRNYYNSQQYRNAYNHNRNTENRNMGQRNYDRGNRESKEAKDKRRREFLEERRRRLEAMRRNPVSYRQQQTKLRLELRRNSHSKSNSVEVSRSGSVEQHIDPRLRNRRPIGLRPNVDRPRRIRNKKRRGKKNRLKRKNCATREPKYPWVKPNQNISRINESRGRIMHSRYNDLRNNRQMRRPGFESRRPTRSVSKPRHVEVLLVADKTMTDFHSASNLQTYLLTIMNIVSSLYMKPSIGNYIKVVVVKIIVVEEMRTVPELIVSQSADKTLESFCGWQMQLNPHDDENPHHHDVAILVTRRDICSKNDAPCSTLGVAHVAGMCKPDRSCSVNEDNGMTLAHTITHELGHNFGLYHDTKEIGCHRREGDTLHIMTPVFEADTVHVAWSKCSKRDVTIFLDAGLGECLSDKPSQEEYVYPEVPAGVMFDATSQCHLQFGSEAVLCPGADPDELCVHLWCLVNNTCLTMLRPAAPGTTCGPDRWCQNLTCVGRQPSPQPRDGGWGPWAAWSDCSRTCGAGVSTRTRECNSPPPENDGAYCIGDRSRYKICNTDPCPINEPSFREIQCAKYNNHTYKNKTITDWIPYFDPDKPCELQCVSRDSITDELMDGFVADGTPCVQSEGARNMCITGVCYKVGCDWIVDSDLEDDKCGVCGGNGSACQTVQGIYTKGTTRQSGFSEVAVIPAGSRNVKIQEKVSPGNYITIGSAKSKKIYLNGARNTTLTEYFVAGTQAIYERDRDWEKVRISGPLAEDIRVYQRIFRGQHRNPGVTYQYTVDRQPDRRRYQLSAWTACSATCGRGYTRRYYECIDEHHKVVEQSQCYHIEPPRHEALMQECHRAACPTPTPARLMSPLSHTHWWVGSWGHCSRTCHMNGEEVTKERGVYCVNKASNQVVDVRECDGTTKPVNKIKCTDLPAC